MPTCPKCRHHFRVLEDEDDGQHGCPSCGYGDQPDIKCIYCNGPLPEDEDSDENYEYPYCSTQCVVNAQAEDEEEVA